MALNPEALKATNEWTSTEQQVALIRDGRGFVQLLRPATIHGGIYRFDAARQAMLVRGYEAAVKGLKVQKFVPASGAATRMFKRIYSWIEAPIAHQDAIEKFFAQAEELAFFEDWMRVADEHDLETFEAGLNSKVAWLKLLVSPDALAFAQMPKGLIPFHLYSDVGHTPIVEHLKEGLAYTEQGGVVSIALSVSPEHEPAFKHAVDFWINQPPFNAVSWDVSYTQQDPATDTIALSEDGELVKHEDGSLLKRPGGHGALIHNLNRLDADMVFIKNIDNVAHERLLSTTVWHKKVLAGLLLEFRADLRLLKKDLEKGLVDEQHINEIRERWGVRIPRDYKKLKAYINRPIRVCGMVKNQGEPGGGPFWTMDPHTGESLQIVEKAQIDPSDSRQQRIAEGATHFNPVDLVCYLKDMNEKAIDLTQFVAEDQYFIVDKSYEGQQIKGLEWPGLWNGAMAHWITLFVEVPIETFNPVKELSDLFRENHR